MTRGLCGIFDLDPLGVKRSIEARGGVLHLLSYPE